MNGTVSVAGTTVSPGDIVVGDRDGVVVVARESAVEIANRLELVRKAEVRTEKQIKQGKLRRFWDPAHFEERGVVYVD